MPDLPDADRFLQRAAKRLEGVRTETFENFRSKNTRKYPLGYLFDLNRPYVLIGDSEIREMFIRYDGWTRFYGRYPGAQGLMVLSRVGFDPEGTQALVYVGNQSHWLAGAGYLVLLIRGQGQWKVEGKVLVWVS